MKMRLWLLCNIVIGLVAALIAVSALAQEEKLPIVVDGDHVEFLSEEKQIVASGHVIIKYKDTQLIADKVTVYSQTKDVVAEGNVKLEYEKGTLEGDKILYNFEDKTGSIINAQIDSEPFFGKSPLTKKVSDRELILRRGAITTCDLVKPHWRIIAKRIEIFPEDRIVAKRASFFVGNWPFITLPQYVHLLNDRRPRVTVVPGKDRDWGYFVLTAWRYYINEGAKGRLHLDYRERKDFAHGVDFAYKPKDMGEGLLRTYYMHERAIESNRIFSEERDTKEKERFRIQWRHKWQIDPVTGILWEYNKMKDGEFLKDYYEREYHIAASPKTYMQLTQAHDIYSFNILTEKRVNRFDATLEKLPQISLETIDFRLGESRFYLKSDNEFSNLINQTAGESAFDDITSRLDTYNKISYPTRLGFVYAAPYIGIRQTYYSQDARQDHNIVRGILYSGTDISTRFNRIFEVKGKFFGMDIDRLRHVINPTVTYSYIHEPTISSSTLQSFDDIDSISKANYATLSLQDKLQTKREGASIDLINHILSSDYYVREPNLGGHLSDIVKSQLELRPKEGLRMDVDTDINRRRNSIISNATDFYIERKDKFNLGVGHRYQKDQDNQFTFDTAYRLNPKWKARVYERFDFTGGGLKEQQYIISRDLHCWLMEVSYRVDRDRGETIWFSFNIKAFPEVGFEFDNSYHEPKAGSQSY